jgi:hypothetical protein
LLDGAILWSQLVRKCDLFACDDRSADLELNLRVCEEWDLAWVAGDELA